MLPHVDTMKVLPVFLLLLTIFPSIHGRRPDTSHKRTKPPNGRSESMIAESAEESSHRYSDHYESNQQPGGDQRYTDPQKKRSNGDYQPKDEEVPQAYKFGYEINDEHEGHQYRHEQKDEEGNVQGQFGYRDAKGQYRQVDYVADGHGFRAKVKTNEAGVDHQNPADIEIQKEEGQDYQKEYTKNIETGHSGDKNILYHSEKSSSTNYGHHQPEAEDKELDYYNRQRVETKPHGATKHYHRQPVIESEQHREPQHYHRQPVVEGETHGASKHYHRKPVVQRAPHSDSEHYHRQAVVERAPHSEKEHYHRQTVEGEPASHYYQRQPLMESEPHNYEYRKHADPQMDYSHYSFPHSSDQEEDEYHQSKSGEEGSSHMTDQYYTKEHNTQSENEHSPDEYQETPRTEMYKQVHKIVPPKPYEEKEPGHSPTTYQYQLEVDGPSYRYVKRPVHSEAKQTNANRHRKEYHTKHNEPKKANLEEMKIKEPKSHNMEDYEDVSKSIARENYDSREQKFILPQSAAKDFDIHSYQSTYPHSHEVSDQDHPQEESDVLKYDYNGYSMSDHRLKEPTEIEPEAKDVPEMHQYTQIDNSEGTNQDIFNTYYEHYGHRQVPQEKTMVQPQQIIIMHPQDKVHMQHKAIAYEDKNYRHKLPQTSSLQSLSYNMKNHDQQALQKAVLELNPEVYKKLMENKSPGQRIVAVPINGGNTDNSAQSAEPPHGVLHIHLDGESASAFNPKNAELILSLAGEENGKTRNNGDKYQVHIPQSHHEYLPSSEAQMQKANTKRSRNKVSKTWIPMTPSWRSQTRRSSNNGGGSQPRTVRSRSPSTQISNREAFKFLQAESSNRAIDFQKQPPKVKAIRKPQVKIIPGIYIVNTAARAPKSNDSKSSMGHKVVSVVKS